MAFFQRQSNNLNFVQPRKATFAKFRTIENDPSTTVQIFTSAPLLESEYILR